MSVAAARLFDVLDATWPAARIWGQDGWMLRDGRGGGKRVSAATQWAPVAEPQQAIDAMAKIGQAPLFMIRQGEVALDAQLAKDGFQIVDPVTLYLCEIDRLLDCPIPPVTAFAVWEPLAIMIEIWVQGGIGPARRAVMARAKTKTAIFARWKDRPAGVGFAALHDGVCMVHAVEVLPHQRRQGVAGWIMRKAAFWAKDHGASHISVLCTNANTAANAMYRGLGMQVAGQYHYRAKET